MVVFPNAKINLGLNVISKREDGFHNISSIFYPVPYEDILEILPSTNFRFDITGADIPGDKDGNLIVKGYRLLQAAYNLPPVQIHLHKILPMGAGLGGGSADAAFTIKSLNQIFDLNLSDETMKAYAGKLGSDCPFFIKNKPVLAQGTGNVFSDINISLKGKFLVLMTPDIHVSTVAAYSSVSPQLPELGIREIIEKMPLSQWKDYLINDFELSVFNLYPEIAKIKEQMYTTGAVYASMSGSGSSVFGIFDSEPEFLPFDKVSWQGILR